MLNKTEAARLAFRSMDQRFLALQAVRDKIEAARSSHSKAEYSLYAEWEEAYRRFHRAHEAWRDLAWTPAKPPTEPTLDLDAIDPSSLNLDALDFAV
jgi:hypothetical protein